MDNTMTVALAIGWAAAGILALIAVALRGRLQAERLLHQRAEQEHRALHDRCEASEAGRRAEAERRAAAEARVAELPALAQERAQLQHALARLQARCAELEERLTQERQNAAEKLALIDQAQTRLADAFKALSVDALQHNNQRFLELARENLGRFQQSAQANSRRARRRWTAS